MVKKFTFILVFISIFFTSLLSDNSNNDEIFEKNCVYCHKMLLINLKDMFFKYLLRYSSEKSVKTVMFYYLKNPTTNLSVMPKEYIKIFGIKQKSSLSDEELKKAIDIYWEKYKVFGKLK